MTEDTALREEVRERYAASARAVITGTGVACDCSHPGTTCEQEGHVFGAALYGEAEGSSAPEGAVAASLGCGVPTAVAGLNEGERCLTSGLARAPTF